MYDEELKQLMDQLGLSEADRRRLWDLAQRMAARPGSAETVLLGGERVQTREAAPKLQPGRPDRYVDLGAIATGGMGDVRRVRDADLQRTVAMKILRRDRVDDPRLVGRFLEEAQATAQLQHPNIVPVHELGRLPDGRVYFTMREVRGQTLTRVIRELHAVSREGTWGVTATGYTFRRVVDAFHQACHAVAYAHDRGIVHRDLKPDNIMVGPYGEVQVMDWGLAKVLDSDTEDPVEVSSGRIPTRAGRVAGTPNYMAPEQAFASPTIGPQVDVYGLGATLYELLSGRPPITGTDARDVIARVRRGERPPPLGHIEESVQFAETRTFTRGDLLADERPPLPRELVAVCDRALSVQPADRYPDAAAMAAEIGSWLDGVRRSEDAKAVVEAATALIPEAEALRVRAQELRASAARLLQDVPRWASDDLKEAAWAIQDEAGQLEAEADLKDIDAEGMLRGAIAVAPGLEDAHAALAERSRDAHAAAEEQGDTRAATRAEVALRAHTMALPEGSDLRASLLDYLDGSGRLRIRTVPQATRARLYRYVQTGRRLLPVFSQDLTPEALASQRLAMGSYLLHLQAPGTVEVRYPVSIGRQGRWTSRPPGSPTVEPVRLPPEGDLGPDDCYIPAGWTSIGGGESDTPRRRFWVDGLVMRRFPVTNVEYIAFLDDLVALGREQEALSHVPRERTGEGGASHIYGRDDAGRFVLVPDEDGDVWQPDWPVVMVDWRDATAYAAWLAERTGLPWRLPTQWEWEKAARGVDARTFPWGNHGEDSWACTRFSHRERPVPSVVGAYPEDEGPYGVRGLAGNVQEWCLDDFQQPVPASGERAVVPEVDDDLLKYRCLRGGAWTMPVRMAAATLRSSAQGFARFSHLGFRVARSYP